MFNRSWHTYERHPVCPLNSSVTVEEREGKQVVSLQPARTQEPRNFVRETSGPYVNGRELNHYTSSLRDEQQKFLQPAVG